MIGRQIDGVQRAANGGATVDAHAECHQRNGRIGMLLSQEADDNECHSGYPEGECVEELPHRGQREALALEQDIGNDQIHIR